MTLDAGIGMKKTCENDSIDKGVRSMMKRGIERRLVLVVEENRVSSMLEPGDVRTCENENIDEWVSSMLQRGSMTT